MHETLSGTPTARAADNLDARYRDEILPNVMDACYKCHADGEKKGGVSLDLDARGDGLLRDRTVWWSVLKNVRAGLMPPAGKGKLDASQTAALADWIRAGRWGSTSTIPTPAG